MRTKVCRLRKFARIPPSLQDSIDTLLQISFPWVFEQATPEHKDRFCSGKDIYCHIVVLEGSIPIGHAAVLKRSILYKGRPILLGGVGGMCVAPKKRKHGIGKSILETAMEELRRDQCDITYLCTDPRNKWLVDFYASVGFVPLRRPHTYLGVSGKRYSDTDGMVAPVCSMEKFNLVKKSRTQLDIGRGNW